MPGDELAQQAARSGVWDYDVTGDRVWWSREANDVMGLPRDAQPQFDEAIAAIDPRDREATTAALMEVMAEGERWDREYRIATPGATAWIHAIGRIDRDAPDLGRERPGLDAELAQVRHELARLAEAKAGAQLEPVGGTEVWHGYPTLRSRTSERPSTVTTPRAG